MLTERGGHRAPFRRGSPLYDTHVCLCVSLRNFVLLRLDAVRALEGDQTPRVRCDTGSTALVNVGEDAVGGLCERLALVALSNRSLAIGVIRRELLSAPLGSRSIRVSSCVQLL